MSASCLNRCTQKPHVGLVRTLSLVACLALAHESSLGGTISGRLARPDNRPLAGIPLLIEQVGGESAPWQAVTGPDGSYAVSDPTLFGNLRVTPQAPGFIVTPTSQDLFFDTNGTADFTLRRRGILIEVRSPTGAPLPSVEIRATGGLGDGLDLVEGVTGANGTFLLHRDDAITGSTWAISFHHPDLLFSPIRVFVGGSPDKDFPVPVKALDLTSQSILPASNREAAYWADYNADGRPDLLLVPGNNSSASTPRLLRHDLTEIDGRPIFSVAPGAAFSAATAASAAWRDFDNDGDLDLAIAGDGSVLLYEQGPSGFRRSAQLPAVRLMSTGSMAAGDVDGDGLKDLVVAGSSIPKAFPSAVLLLNRGGLQFADPVPLFPAAGAAALIDLDLDGALDLTIGGVSSGPSAAVHVYQNLGGTLGFTRQLTQEPGNFQALAWSDFDGDGLPDLAFTSSQRSAILRNSANGTFIRHQEFPRQIGDIPQTVAWGDLNNDGIPELLFSALTKLVQVSSNGASIVSRFAPNTNGFSAAFVDLDRNGVLDLPLLGNESNAAAPGFLTLATQPRANQAPSAPAGLRVERVGNTHFLRWSEADDDTTPIPSLSYNLRVGTKPGGVDIISPESDPFTGQRWIFERGPAEANVWQLRNLKPGIYHWAVQAIDNSFAGGPWSAEQAFFVTDGIGPELTLLGVLPNGQIQLQLQAPIGRWDIESSEDLIRWTRIGEVSQIAGELFGFTAPAPPRSPLFYRARVR